MSETRMLPVNLTGEEFEARSGELAAKVGRLTALEEEKKATAKRQKEECDDARANVVRLATIVAQRSELRPVEVIERFDLERRIVLEVRTDTGDVVCSRPMSTAEVVEHEQARLPFGKSASAASDEAAKSAAVGT